ncbi:MAG: methionyl-tRNA formyltransferase [Hyphomonadaceae bacterium]|nr:methionyl-tRNA formyltransferase [Hyphomonadaceae bacterium]
MRPLRLAFMGSPDFSVPTLDALISAGHEIACVYTQPPKPAGRGRKLRPTPVQAHADDLSLPVRTPASLKGKTEQDAFAALNLDAAVVIAYGLILPQIILDAPHIGAMNLHASTLPRWRGAAPIQRAIMAGDRMTGVDAMVMEAGLDTGPVLASETCRIFPFDTAGELHDRLAALAADLAPRALEGWAEGRLHPRLQDEAGVTYAHKITAEDQRIDWTRPAAELDCQIRGLSPFPGAWFEWTPPGADAPLRIKALMSERVDSAGAPGAALDDALGIACGEGALRITRLQRPGRGPMEAADFLRGSPIPAGTVLA